MTQGDAIRRDPGDVRLVNCSGCNVALLGESEAEWAASLPPALRRSKPEVMAGRRRGRPYCQECLQAFDVLHKYTRAGVA